MADINIEDNRLKLFIEEVKNIQDIVKRMAANSFNVKTWAITLVAGTLLLKGSDKHFFIAFIPLFAFWYLDAYYLRQERLFRKVYDWIISYRPNNDDQIFNVNPMRFDNQVKSIFQIMYSVSLLPFYGGIFLAILGYIVVSKWMSILTLFKCISICYLGGH
ncbi:MAG: hypothetical protein M0P91_10190 [Sulfuricurvum sp.]|uniref:hypothetical protein n=1 Tax=Sulfuricurvum sp. TaxID=2025608 RepID=UPI0025F669D3|nr:hypothetical protein [Sulfuricurvum sp.]MCK9373557.1 hypothetical protein [Sulfuricurvum sp.]